MPTLSCLVAPPCTLVLLIVCKRRSLPWLLPPSRSRLLLPQKGNTLSGLEDPSWHPSPPSNRCGSPSKSTMNVVHQLFTENASKLKLYYCFFMYLSECFITITKYVRKVSQKCIFNHTQFWYHNTVQYHISSKFSKFSIKIRIVPAFSEFSEDFFLISSKVNSSKGSKVEISHWPTKVSRAKLLFHTLIFKGS